MKKIAIFIQMFVLITICIACGGSNNNQIVGTWIGFLDLEINSDGTYNLTDRRSVETTSGTWRVEDNMLYLSEFDDFLVISGNTLHMVDDPDDPIYGKAGTDDGIAVGKTFESFRIRFASSDANFLADILNLYNDHPFITEPITTKSELHDRFDGEWVEIIFPGSINTEPRDASIQFSNEQMFNNVIRWIEFVDDTWVVDENAIVRDNSIG